jgi:hypothetical protein
MFAFFDLKKQIRELRQELDTQKRTVNGLELEWSDMHDRLRRMLAKISKREERALAAEGTQPEEGENGASSVAFSSLTPRQRLLQAQILARRKTAGERKEQ